VTATVRYSEWRANRYADQLDHYTSKFAGGSRDTIRDTIREAGRPVRYIWRNNHARGGLYQSTSMYLDEPWTLSVDAPTIAARDQALLSLVKFRPAAQLRGKAAR
jgi:hypothetical protein